jgi:hypothetical protein
MSGISFERSEVPMRQVIDGLSRTYLIGERQIPDADYKTGYNMGDNEIGCTGFNNDNYCKTGRLAGDEISSNSRHIETVTSPMPCKVIALALPTPTAGTWPFATAACSRFPTTSIGAFIATPAIAWTAISPPTRHADHR